MSVKPSTNQLDWTLAEPTARVEPTTSKKNTGWQVLEPLPAQSMNWILYSISIWIAYLDSITSSTTESVSAAYTVAATDQGKILRLSSASAPFNIQLPDPAESEGLKFTIKSVDSGLRANPVTLKRFGAESIEGLASDYVLESNFGSWEIVCSGGNYFFV